MDGCCGLLLTDHDFLREIVVIYSLNFCFCYCCLAFATALVVFGFFGFRYYLYDSLAVLVPFLYKHTHKAYKKYFLHAVPTTTMAQKCNVKSKINKWPPEKDYINTHSLPRVARTHPQCGN